MKFGQLALLGPLGVDVKGQAIALSKRWHIPYVSMDELWRNEIAKESELGLEIGAYVEKDLAIPDALMMTLMRRRIEQPDMWDGWIASEFPRTLAQAQAFDELLVKFERPAVEIAYFKVTAGLLISRLAAADSDLTAIRQRLAQYEEESAPLLEYYQQSSRLTIINGSRSEAEITHELSELLCELGDEEAGAARFVRDEAELDSLIAEGGLVVVDCIASWCGPCKLVTPLIDRLAAELENSVTVVKLDFDNNRSVSKRFGLKGMPSVMIFKAGELMTTLTGVKSYERYSSMVKSLL